jgi:hypothetical protein
VRAFRARNFVDDEAGQIGKCRLPRRLISNVVATTPD